MMMTFAMKVPDTTDYTCVYVSSKNILAFYGLSKSEQTVLQLRNGVKLTVDEHVHTVASMLRKSKEWRR